MDTQSDNIVLNNAARTVEGATFNRIVKVTAGILEVSPMRENEDETVYRLSEILLAIAVRLEKLELRTLELGDNTKVIPEIMSLLREQGEFLDRLVSPPETIVVPTI